MADLECPVHPPSPTHQRYVKGEPQRHEVTLEGEILPWVSMAQALGWDPQDQVGFPRLDGDEGEFRERDHRPASEPSFTLGEKVHSWDRIIYRNGSHDHAALRPASEPAPTLHFGARSNKVDWVFDRPATTVLGDSRIWPPGHKVNSADIAAGRDHYEGRAGRNAIRVSVEEAAVLQSFPVDYPFQGTRSKRFQQVGNAVPPLLASAILSHLIRGGAA